MRLMNGLFAFGTLLYLTTVLQKEGIPTYFGCFVGFLFLIHLAWFANTRQGYQWGERITHNIVIAIFGLPLAWLSSCACGLLIGNVAPTTITLIAILVASADGIYCIKKIAVSLPQSFRISMGGSVAAARAVCLPGPIERMSEAQELGRDQL